MIESLFETAAVNTETSKRESMLLNWDQTMAPSLTKATIITTVKMTFCPPSQEISHFINIYERFCFLKVRTEQESQLTGYKAYRLQTGRDFLLSLKMLRYLYCTCATPAWL